MSWNSLTGWKKEWLLIRRGARFGVDRSKGMDGMDGELIEVARSLASNAGLACTSLLRRAVLFGETALTAIIDAARGVLLVYLCILWRVEWRWNRLGLLRRRLFWEAC